MVKESLLEMRRMRRDLMTRQVSTPDQLNAHIDKVCAKLQGLKIDTTPKLELKADEPDEPETVTPAPDKTKKRPKRGGHTRGDSDTHDSSGGTED